MNELDSSEQLEPESQQKGLVKYIMVYPLQWNLIKQMKIIIWKYSINMENTYGI